MISKKIFTNADGNVTRFLSDFIVRSQDFARPYAYIYDNTLDPGGTQDQLQDGSTDQADWSWPDNIWKRGSNTASSSDLVTVDKWQVVDNSILFFTAPLTDTTLWLEVATTAEEFGDTLTQASVLAAEAAALAAAGSAVDASGYANDAQASAASIASQDAQITTNTTNISTNIINIATKLPKDGSEPMTGNLEAPSMSIGGVTIDVNAYGIVFGSNANGEYTKFPDGTMICTLAKASDQTTLETWTFPSVFTTNPIISGNHLGTATAPRMVSFTNRTLSSVQFDAYSDTGVKQTVTCHLIAIGRWK